jgi:hypothetical protein
MDAAVVANKAFSNLVCKSRAEALDSEAVVVVVVVPSG